MDKTVENYFECLPVALVSVGAQAKVKKTGITKALQWRLWFMAGGRRSDRAQLWIDARKRHRLSHAQVQMARELGMNPKKLGKIDNHKQEPWKLPLPQLMEKLYYKRFRKERPDVLVSIEERARKRQAKKEANREKKPQLQERSDGYGTGTAQNDDDIPF